MNPIEQILQKRIDILTEQRNWARVELERAQQRHASWGFRLMAAMRVLSKYQRQQRDGGDE